MIELKGNKQHKKRGRKPMYIRYNDNEYTLKEYAKIIGVSYITAWREFKRENAVNGD